jgi:hypothetical protein
MRRSGKVAVGATIDREHTQRDIDTSLAKLRERLSTT